MEPPTRPSAPQLIRLVKPHKLTSEDNRPPDRNAADQKNPVNKPKVMALSSTVFLASMLVHLLSE
jgi:hypothetical protein